MVFLLHVGRLTLAISRFASRNRILCEAALDVFPKVILCEAALDVFPKVCIDQGRTQGERLGLEKDD